ncbi:MAG TPA: lipopolysaccharide biosynthesis protein [Bradyrhizobium sp.]|jgi:O-antigen/teichoic acid export membrane protein
MLIGQTSINLSANILSALLGLSSVFIFTRLFSAHDYGVYLLGVGFASVVSTFLAGWFRNIIMSGHARNDGTDVRGLVISGYLVSCLTVPVAYGLGRLVGLDGFATAAALALAIAIGLFELTQDLVRARLLAITAMRGTLVRAASILVLGAIVATITPTGVFLLVSAAAACLLAIAVQARAWHGTRLTVDRTTLVNAAKHGLPLTLSLTLLAISSVTDRFVIANLVTPAEAGRYIAGLDLVRQTLMMPAMSAAAVFFPLAIKINASEGPAAVRSHLRECVELLLGFTLPAALGFAVISSHVANVILGADFRALAAQTMPIVAVSVIFQILTQQYLHTSFLLSGRNSFYLINTASIITANVILSCIFVSKYGTVGAAWARLGADVFGFAGALLLSNRAYPIPFPPRRVALTAIAALAMAVIVGTLDRNLHTSDLAACGILAGAGAASYVVLCWLLDISRTRSRLRFCVTFFRTKLANRYTG